MTYRLRLGGGVNFGGHTCVWGMRVPPRNKWFGLDCVMLLVVSLVSFVRWHGSLAQAWPERAL